MNHNSREHPFCLLKNNEDFHLWNLMSGSPVLWHNASVFSLKFVSFLQCFFLFIICETLFQVSIYFYYFHAGHSLVKSHCVYNINNIILLQNHIMKSPIKLQHLCTLLRFSSSATFANSFISSWWTTRTQPCCPWKDPSSPDFGSFQ